MSELIFIIKLKIDQRNAAVVKNMYFTRTFKKPVLLNFLHFTHKLFEKIDYVFSVIYYSFQEGLCENAFQNLLG